MFITNDRQKRISCTKFKDCNLLEVKRKDNIIVLTIDELCVASMKTLIHYKEKKHSLCYQCK